jgi:hypothetical protein
MTRSLCTDAGAGLPATVPAALGAGRARFLALDWVPIDEPQRGGINGHPFPGRRARPIIDKSLNLFRLLKLICLST